MATTNTREILIKAIGNDAKDLADIAELFKAYAQSLGIDLAFQDFSNELASLPGKYVAPSGALVLARKSSNQAVGCVALRSLSDPGYCEMKRLFVSPQGRGAGLGRMLAEAVVQEAECLGYKAMRLDTLESMSSARALYKSLGFRDVERYYETPLAGTIFLELTLSP
ncbi:hypothetical protein LTR56_015439 [Elasticomyces elasticus]|nr:hypothetical protein LTR56_015439 [Elasticomyces elasticus]KAK3646022.1 hypothetical protein LTR22_014457 [Elasticomyces elasticus]KAK4904058.1 hypothetical protein LTR49_026432 [Elasticomyces elasticus]KAK5761796.1 hypothetical protein LTS12_008051 [Elasticomyces elasticus]